MKMAEGRILLIYFNNLLLASMRLKQRARIVVGGWLVWERIGRWRHPAHGHPAGSERRAHSHRIRVCLGPKHVNSLGRYQRFVSFEVALGTWAAARKPLVDLRDHGTTKYHKQSRDMSRNLSAKLTAEPSAIGRCKWLDLPRERILMHNNNKADDDSIRTNQRWTH